MSIRTFKSHGGRWNGLVGWGEGRLRPLLSLLGRRGERTPGGVGPPVGLCASLRPPGPPGVPQVWPGVCGLRVLGGGLGGGGSGAPGRGVGRQTPLLLPGRGLFRMGSLVGGAGGLAPGPLRGGVKGVCVVGGFEWWWGGGGVSHSGHGAVGARERARRLDARASGFSPLPGALGASGSGEVCAGVVVG